MDDFIKERFELALERITEITQESYEDPAFADYFRKTAAFLCKAAAYYAFCQNGENLKAELSVLQEVNRGLYEDILPEHYGKSFGNPAYAVERLGKEYGGLMSALYSELRGVILPAAEGEAEAVLIRMELFVEIYGMFVSNWQECEKLPDGESIRQAIYWYISDYSDITAEWNTARMLLPEKSPAVKIVMESDLTDPRYLYAYGEYVTDNEIRMAQYMASLPQEKVDKMADTYTEGYRMGFVLGNKDLSKKKTVELRYALGFERMMRKAVNNFAKMGLKPIIRRTPVGLLENGGLMKLGSVGANPNKQYDFDHKNDRAIYWDKAMMQRKLEVMHTAYEALKTQAADYAGPAVVETFGEKPFEPVSCEEALQVTAEQQKLWVEYRTQVGMLQRQYIIEEERSFTIIAFPVPEIGENFEAIFDDVIRINTLDYMKYRRIQQCLIDALDTAVKVEIKGMNGNRTDLTVALWKLQDPQKETIFENCVADVNIPVGEVFTSPVLKGTNGLLHVTKVYLNELEYKNLSVEFKDGMIASYDCDNFETKEENQRFIKENILFHQETLPMGEFAIGTNTTAYVIAEKWGIQSQLPILIAEKTGPHFAVGDTCYSHGEEIRVYNPDGKEIVAKDNEMSLKRDTDPAGAYFNCHTDITIPYDELGELTAVRADGSRILIIEKGRFVLPGCEELNEAFS